MNKIINTQHSRHYKKLFVGRGVGLGSGHLKNVKVGRYSVPITYFIAFVVFISVIVLLNIHTATMGAKLSHLETKEEELIKQKHDLEDQVVRTSSLSKISEKAEELGFSNPSDVVYLTAEDPVAKLLN
jgi:hypothetical protein